LLDLLDSFPNFYHNILTNGVLLEGRVKDEIEKRNPHLIISLDGISVNHNKYRNNSFDIVINNILNYKYPKRISLGMTVNIDTLPYLYDSLEYMNNLPIGSYETHLNLHDNWTDQLFLKYIKIIENFISNNLKLNYLPNCGIEKRFANYFNAKKYNKDGGGPVHQIDINGNILI
jgi:sulfatase maturation enzyme AslB (radical SAM superfamily)